MSGQHTTPKPSVRHGAVTAVVCIARDAPGLWS
jgi:hypothetical protein